MKSLVVGIVIGALALVGCGPSPAYEDAQYPLPEPRPAETQPVQQPQQADAQPSSAGAPQQQANGDVQIGASNDEYADTDPSALQDFRGALDGHGQWVDDPTYGTVWVPASSEVGSDFQPYVTAGHWTYSDQESWVWVSDYDWGWAPFHYGRWVYLPGSGWSWIPGRVYSGAWVTWRTGPYGYEYVGWAPMAPEWYWWNGVAVGWGFGWYYPRYYYCHHDYLYRGYVGNYVVRGGTPAAAPIEARTQPYHPASPGVGGVNGTGHTPASPSVNGRVAATPSVNGTNGSMVRMAQNGPKPNEIGLKGENIPAPPTSGGLAKAHAFANPATAQAVGGSAPANTRPRPVDAVAGNRAPAGAGGVERGGMSPSVANRLEPAARAPQYATRPTVENHPSTGGASSFNGSSAARSAQAAPRDISPPGAYHPQPVTRPVSPSYSAPSHSYSNAPSYHPSSPSYSAPSHYSAPSYSAPSHSYSPSPSYAAPSYHSSTPSRSAPSVSRGGGGRRR